MSMPMSTHLKLKAAPNYLPRGITIYSNQYNWVVAMEMDSLEVPSPCGIPPPLGLLGMAQWKQQVAVWISSTWFPPQQVLNISSNFPLQPVANHHSHPSIPATILSLAMGFGEAMQKRELQQALTVAVDCHRSIQVPGMRDLATRRLTRAFF